jgi:hypothetical protein
LWPKIALGTGLVLGGAAIPPIVGALLNGDGQEQPDPDQGESKPPWHGKSGDDIQVDVW